MSGFTIVEALVTVVIFTMIFIPLFGMMNQGLRYWHVAEVNIELQQDLRRGLMVMDNQLRQTRTSKISIPADDNYYNSIVFNIPQDTDGDGDAVDALGNIEWSGNITYALNQKNQIVRTSSAGNLVLANNITSLQFKRFSGNPEMVEIALTAQGTTVPGKISSMTISSLVMMRN
ncbi:MAG: hypothetical protein PHO42_05665 [Candidatus Omnitrophica bacterium]|nr:hypothetical protein [Candidatus Omnitrophota bacterium]